MEKQFDICIVGGFGHVGLPLGLAFADKGLNVALLDIDENAFKTVSEGKMPFVEYGSDEILPRVLANGKLKPTLDPKTISQSDTVIFVTGTPIDKHLNPDVDELLGVFRSYLEYLQDGQLIILRSTVYPGTTERVQRFFRNNGMDVDVAFCPERIAQGYSVKELKELPHIVSSFSDNGVERASKLFKVLNERIVVLKPLEAELTKLFSNAYRYITFAIANQFFVMANECGADYYKIHDAMKKEYERCKDLPSAGFAAGPCLFKDTVQLSAFNAHNFVLGDSSILINEGLPYYLISRLKRQHDLKTKTVGILGMSFKANIDDKRDSLSYKLKKILSIEAKKVLCSDVFIKDDGFVDTDTLIRESDIIILGVPHKQYKEVKIEGKVVVDIWNIFGNGCKI